MYKNPTKRYYTILEGLKNTMFGIDFINEAIILLKYYNSNKIDLFDTEYSTNYAKLKSVSINYQQDITAYTVSQLIDKLKISIIVTNDLKEQIKLLNDLLSDNHLR